VLEENLFFCDFLLLCSLLHLRNRKTKLRVFNHFAGRNNVHLKTINYVLEDTMVSLRFFMLRGYAKHEIVTVLLNAVQAFCTLKTGRIATKTEKASLQRFSVTEIKFTSANRNRLLKQKPFFYDEQ